MLHYTFFFFKAEDGIRDYKVTGVQTCALPISHLFREALVPVGARVGRGEQLLDDRPALSLERRERPRHVLARLAERPVEGDRVLEPEAGSGADREMHGAQRVADQDQTSRGPAPVRQERKLPPPPVVP